MATESVRSFSHVTASVRSHSASFVPILTLKHPSSFPSQGPTLPFHPSPPLPSYPFPAIGRCACHFLPSPADFHTVRALHRCRRVATTDDRRSSTPPPLTPPPLLPPRRHVERRGARAGRRLERVGRRLDAPRCAA